MAAVLTACGDEKIAERIGGNEDALTIKHQVGMNVVGRVTVDGSPREGVVVSDGITVVATDKNGEYQMRSSGRQHVFVSIPADCELPVEEGLPKFYKTLDFSKGHIIQRNFNLKRREPSKDFTLVAFADVQIGGKKDVAEFVNPVMPGILSHTSTLKGTVIGISLGDICWNNTDLYADYKREIVKNNFPVFSVIGNHDHNAKYHNDTESDIDFRNAFGPTYYSYNIGDWHIVVLDDIFYRGVTSHNDYDGSITQQQLDWLKKDLAFVDKSKSLIVGLHIPTSRRGSSEPGISNSNELYALIKDYHQVNILSGHVHNNCTTTLAPNMTEYSLGAVMGAWWNHFEHLGVCNDGSPRGYGVFTFSGNELKDEYYIGDETARDYQLKVYPPKEASMRFGRASGALTSPFDAVPLMTDDTHVLINIFNWHTTWKVEVKEDDGQWTVLDRNALTYDPLAVRLLQYGNPWEQRPSAGPGYTDHVFLYSPSNAAWKTITARATDPFGNVYTASANHE